MGECCLAAGRREGRGRVLRRGLGDRVSRKEFPHELTERRTRLVRVHIRRAAQETYRSTGSRLAMTKKTPAYGARAAKAPLAPMTIERRDPGSHDVEIEILYCGICHSDVHKVNDDWGTTHFPVVPGHEIVGRVLSQGASASRFREGDLVGVGCIVDSCRTCPECRAGREMFCVECVTFSFDSLERDGQNWTYGGYTANMVVDERYVVRIPKGLDPARAAPLMCAGITTYSPLRQFGCKRGDQVAVVGLGGLGHMVVKFAASMGADVTVLIRGNKRLAGSNIGGIPETQEMLDYCGKHGLVADVELIKAKQINDAYARMERGDVRYRFVIDGASFGA